MATTDTERTIVPAAMMVSFPKEVPKSSNPPPMAA
jgi:hypothetical protein